ncbi:MAG TPA: polysaccharide deacetylase family protein [Propionibacteriaceae bacterium]
MSHRRLNRGGAAAAAIGLGVGVGYWTGFGSTSQLFGTFPYRGETDERVVALTFDDGPNEPYTSRLLDTLDSRGVRGTFFQVGRCAERFPSATRRVVETGHVLGNHSFSHSFTRYLREPDQRREIERAQDVLHRVSGLVPALYRPPWLCHWPWVLGSVHAQGLQVVSGTFGHPLEVFQPAAQRMADRAAAVTRPGSVLIFHDGREARGGLRDQSVAAIGPLIDQLTDRGYRFATVDELFGVPAYA